MMARPMARPVEAPSACSGPGRDQARVDGGRQQRARLSDHGQRNPGEDHRPAAEAVGRRAQHQLGAREARGDRAKP